MTGLPCLVLLLILAGCRDPGPATPERCASRAPASSTDFQASMARDLIGTYQLTTVHTSQGGEPYPITGKLILTSPDSLRRYYRPRPQGWVRTGEHPVAGIYVPSDGRYPQNMAEVDGEVLYVGCRICPDASPNQYQITWVADSAFGRHVGGSANRYFARL